MINRNFAKELMLDFLEDVVKQLKNSESDEKLSLNMLADCYTKKIDEIILNQENTFNLKYIAGEMKIHYKNEKFFTIEIYLYFQDEKEEWKKTVMSSPDLNIKYLNQESVIKLKDKKIVVFEILHPDEANN